MELMKLVMKLSWSIEKMKESMLIFIFVFYLFCLNTIYAQESKILEVFRIKFIENELEHLLERGNLDGSFNMSQVLPNDSMSYEVYVKKIEDYNFTFGYDLYIGSYRKKTKKISISNETLPRVALMIDSLHNFYFINEKPLLIKFIRNNVNLNNDDELKQLVKLLFFIEYDDLRGELLNTEYDIEFNHSIKQQKFNIEIKRDLDNTAISCYSIGYEVYKKWLFQYDILISNDEIKITYKRIQQIEM